MEKAASRHASSQAIYITDYQHWQTKSINQ